jgi:hypothetical protein
MKLLNTKLFSVYIIAFLILSFSCKPIKNVTSVVKSNTLESVYDSLKISEPDYKTLNIKFNVKYEKKSQTMSLKGNCKILKDSIIWVSLSPGLGIEAARLMCTRDSIFLLDKLNESLTKGKYSYLNNLYKLDVDFNSLQSILTNAFFVYPSKAEEKADFLKTFSVYKDSIDLSVYRKSEEMVENLVVIKKKSFDIKSYFINDISNKRSLSIKYNNSENNQNVFPDLIAIKSMSGEKFLFVDLEYTKVALNDELTFSFKVPSDYRVIVQ